MIPAFQATAAFAPEFAPSRRDVAPWFRRWLPACLYPSGGDCESIDRSTGVYNGTGLVAAVDDAMRRRGDAVAVSAIVLEFSDLREVREIYGAAVARKVVAEVVHRVRAVAGSRGMVGRTGPAQFTVVFVGCAAPRAIRNLERGLGKPPRVELNAGDSEIVLVPGFVVDETECGESFPALQRTMSLELARAQREELRRLHYLTSERERYSRPMGVRPLT